MISEWVSFTNPRSFSPNNPQRTSSCSLSTHYSTCRYFCKDFENSDQPLKRKKKQRKALSSWNDKVNFYEKLLKMKLIEKKSFCNLSSIVIVKVAVVVVGDDDDIVVVSCFSYL